VYTTLTIICPCSHNDVMLFYYYVGGAALGRNQPITPGTPPHPHGGAPSHPSLTRHPRVRAANTPVEAAGGLILPLRLLIIGGDGKAMVVRHLHPSRVKVGGPVRRHPPSRVKVGGLRQAAVAAAAKIGIIRNVILMRTVV